MIGKDVDFTQSCIRLRVRDEAADGLKDGLTNVVLLCVGVKVDVTAPRRARRLHERFRGDVQEG